MGSGFRRNDGIGAGGIIVKIYIDTIGTQCYLHLVLSIGVRFMTVNPGGKNGRSCGRCNVHGHRVCKLGASVITGRADGFGCLRRVIGSPMDPFFGARSPLAIADPVFLKVECSAGGKNNMVHPASSYQNLS